MNAASSSLPPTGIPRPDNEAQRLAALQRHAPFDGPPDPDLDFLTALAAELCAASAAFVSLVDRDRGWVRSAVGLPLGAVPRDEDLAAWSILSPDGLSIADLAADRRTAPLAVAGKPWRMAAAANLTADGLPIGALCVLDTRPRALSLRERELLDGLARQAMGTLEMRAQRRHLAATLAAMELQAATDDLTGLGTRRVLMERLELEVERARRFGTPLSLVKFDLDQFGTLNDQQGHAAGDEVLRNIGRLVRSHLRTLDVAGRYGGATLCVLLPGTPPAGGVEVAKSLRQTIEGYVHRCAGGCVLSVTASFGVAGIEPGATGTTQDLLRQAESALQRAKHGGRNRVET
jgi:diguanylate cyclase (GGDEF)-like protein